MRGFEPDASFYFSEDAAKVRGKRRISLDAGDPPPELLVDVDITSPSASKLPIYARLVAAEVWRHDGDRQRVLGLRNGDEKGRYAEIPEVSPFRDLAWYATTVHTCTYKTREDIVRTERLEVRLDPETRLKLEEVAVARGSSVSELVRDLIERSHEQEVAGAARLLAAERIGSMEFEEVPAPDELKRQLSEAHGPGTMS